jgi:flagellar basal-body M-ring protein/flagellar hook-basal body protein (fliF)
LDQLIQILRNFGAVRLVILASVIIGLGGGLHYFVSRVEQPEMALLYSNLDLSDAGKIITKLEGMGVPTQLQGGGTAVFVPANQVARLRMEMAEIGLPRGGSIGYEIFDKSDSLGTSSFVQDINHLRALEGEIARSISTLSQVASARVHLVLPRRELFSRTHQEPSASIVLSLNGPGKLSPQRVQGIQYMVASAVPSLTPEKVSIVDDRGNLLARSDSNAELLSATNLEEMRLGYQTRLSQIIESLVEKHVGIGKVRAEVAVAMNFDRITENSEEFDPNGQVVRSTQTVNENDTSKEGANQGVVGAQQEIPQGQADQGNAGAATTNNQRQEETINYEISKKVRSLTREVGAVTRLSVAVLVDGTYTPAAQAGEAEVYTPLPGDEIDKLKTLVKNAIGFDEKRGDTIEVINMKFAKQPENGTLKESPSFFSLSQPDVVRLIEASIVGLIGLLILLMVVKPVIIRLLESAPRPPAAPIKEEPSKNTKEAPIPEPRPVKSDDLERMVTLQQVEGQVRESSLKKINNVIEEKPGQTINIIRDWMQENG